MISDYHGLAFEGGGVAGVAHLGVLKYWSERRPWPKFVAGSSAGSILALLVSLDWPYSQIERLVLTTPFRDLVAGSFVGDMYRLVTAYGWSSTNMLRKLLWDQIGDLTFAEHFLKYRTTLIVTATHYNTGSTVYYHYVDHPSKSVVEAIVESCALPLVFAPVVRDSEVYVDGGLLDNYPIRSLYKFLAPSRVCGSKLLGSIDPVFSHPLGYPKNLVDYLRGLLVILLNASLQSHVHKADWERTIKVPIGRVTALDWNITPEQEAVLIRAGYQAAADFFTVPGETLLMVK